MSDPRNVAHAKKVSQEKKHSGTAATVEGAPAAQPGKKSAAAPKKSAGAVATDTTAVPVQETVTPALGSEEAATLEGSLVVLAKLKELEFHSRAHLERLAELAMTVEDELKQPALAAPLNDVYAAQSTVQTKLTALIESYKNECERIQPATS